ncbi:MAG: hypothetical protein VKL39_12955, partial [Leptolyngbyaceae bacterium]|nr:hypothetical protein [Leptolyngbyaceae bacterium]
MEGLLIVFWFGYFAIGPDGVAQQGKGGGEYEYRQDDFDCCEHIYFFTVPFLGFVFPKNSEKKQNAKKTEDFFSSVFEGVAG